MALSKQDREEIVAIIVKTVNGKIEGIDTKFDAHTTEMEPILDAYRSADVIGRLIVYISKITMALGVIAGVIWTGVKYIK